MSGSSWVITPSWLSGSWRSFLYSASVYSCHLYLISSPSVSSILLLPFIVTIFAWNVPLVSLIFLKRSLVFPILLFIYIFFCIDHLGRLSYFYLLFFGTLHSDEYIFPFLFFLLLLLFSADYKVSSNNHLSFLHFFSLGMILTTTFCTVL